MVLDEMCVASFGRLASTPPSPKTTPSTAASSASMVKTTSPLQASAGVPAIVAPRAANGSALARVRL